MRCRGCSITAAVRAGSAAGRTPSPTRRGDATFACDEQTVTHSNSRRSHPRRGFCPHLFRYAVLLLVASVEAAWCCSQLNSAPGSICLGPVLLKPSGFLDIIGVVRSNDTGENVSTDFRAIPLADTPRDWLISARHSRVMLHGETNLFSGTLIGYFEGDFLSPAGSHPWRLRQAWGEYRHGKWRILGGHAWSLLRANQKGISSEKDLIDIDVIDPAYHVGLLGDRKRQIQVIREVRPGWLIAGSYEEGGQIVAKAVHDRKRLHFEAMALGRRDGAWGTSAAAVVHVSKRVSILTQQFVTDGAGKEAVGGPEGVRSYATIQGAEARLPHGTIVFGYGGLVYSARSEGNRIVGEWTVGAKKRLFRWSAAGEATMSAHYSHVERAVWSGRKGNLDYVMISLRFTIPAPQP